ncbi:hypothetical protein V7024_11205 [Bacillus sp. JJ864]|uniref:hypothetical protein n=1 Tax=Bacillus sp. JJ864 TaxID=3122975 RepID=UPI002FFDB9D3
MKVGLTNERKNWSRKYTRGLFVRRKRNMAARLIEGIPEGEKDDLYKQVLFFI